MGKRARLAEYLDRTSSTSIPLDEGETKEMEARLAEDAFAAAGNPNEYIYLDGVAAVKGGAPKFAATLKRVYGGNPKVVHPMPTWLADKLSRWNLERYVGVPVVPVNRSITVKKSIDNILFSCFYSGIR